MVGAEGGACVIEAVDRACVVGAGVRAIVGADVGACMVGAGVGAFIVGDGADVGACVVGAGGGACDVGARVRAFVRWFASGKLKAPQEKKTLVKFAEYLQHPNSSATCLLASFDPVHSGRRFGTRFTTSGMLTPSPLHCLSTLGGIPHPASFV